MSENEFVHHGDKCVFPSVETYMLGRGLLRNPGLISEILQGNRIEKSLLKDFHDSVYQAYQKEYYSEKNVLYKMKEIWFYLSSLFIDSEKYFKKIKKCERLFDYDAVIFALFCERELVKTAPLQPLALG